MHEEKLFQAGFFTGINYWALKNATNMWEDFDAASAKVFDATSGRVSLAKTAEKFMAAE